MYHLMTLKKCVHVVNIILFCFFFLYFNPCIMIHSVTIQYFFVIFNVWTLRLHIIGKNITNINPTRKGLLFPHNVLLRELIAC